MYIANDAPPTSSVDLEPGFNGVADHDRRLVDNLLGGTVETKAAGSRGRSGGLAPDDAGLANAKHTFLPFGVAV